MEDNAPDNKLLQLQQLHHINQAAKKKTYIHKLQEYQTIEISKPSKSSFQKRNELVKIQEDQTDRSNLISMLKQKSQTLEVDNSTPPLIFTQSLSQPQLGESPVFKNYLVKNSFAQKNTRIHLPDMYKSVASDSSNQNDSFSLSKLPNSKTLKNLHQADRKVYHIVSGLQVNENIKHKMAYSLRQSLLENQLHSLDHTQNQERSRNAAPIVVVSQKKPQTDNDIKLPKIKHKDIGKQITEMKLKKIDKITKAYLKDYTVFNYKIDTVLNEAYGFIKNHNR